MKAIIFSDSHGRTGDMIEALEREKNIDLVIFAGDVHSDIEELMEVYPRKEFEFVKGNNDFWLNNVPNDRVFDFDGKKIFLTHGHMYGVKTNPYNLLKKGREMGVDVIIFGHTHSRFMENFGDVVMLNPGAVRSSYGILEVKKGEVYAEIKSM